MIGSASDHSIMAYCFLSLTLVYCKGRKVEVRIINAAYYNKDGHPVSVYADDTNPSLERMVIALLVGSDVSFIGLIWFSWCETYHYVK